MRRMQMFLALVAALFFISPVFCEVAPVILGVYPVPVTETEAFIASWFKEAGFTVSLESADTGKNRLKADKGGKTILIGIRPQSPMDSLVEVYGMDGKQPVINGLKASLESYILSLNNKNGVVPGNVPGKVQSRNKSVVCLRASAKGEPVRFSGFIIDRLGYIIATAHDLDVVHSIITNEDGGVELKGKVVKRDAVRDLTLIKVNKIFDAVVSVKEGRSRLKAGDKVYSIGCPQSLQRMVRAGVVDGPPALVNGQLLWQVNMEVLPGSSGSPVFDQEGRLVGVVKGRYRGTESRGFVIPLDTILDFIGQEIK